MGAHDTALCNSHFLSSSTALLGFCSWSLSLQYAVICFYCIASSPELQDACSRCIVFYLYVVARFVFFSFGVLSGIASLLIGVFVDMFTILNEFLLRFARNWCEFWGGIYLWQLQFVTSCYLRVVTLRLSASFLPPPLQ
jgi:hypothetical protein